MDYNGNQTQNNQTSPRDDTPSGNGRQPSGSGTRRRTRAAGSGWAVFRSLILPLLLPVAVLLVVVLLLGGFDSRSDTQAGEVLADAIERDITACYALEGTYPPSLDYIKQNYGLRYDEDRFYVDYQPVAENIRPSYTILEKE